jgi:hypothetical protein
MKCPSNCQFVASEIDSQSNRSIHLTLVFDYIMTIEEYEYISSYDGTFY